WVCLPALSSTRPVHPRSTLFPYTTLFRSSQARFLMNAGLTELIRAPGDDPAQRARQLTALNTLLSEAEMGELFKVLAVGRGLDAPLLGFVRGDRRDRL